MNARTGARAEAARLRAFFEAAGATPVDVDILQPADTLLDLYGEDIRARAYVTHDPLRGELMLRPDFTVPVVQMHMAEGTEPARYTYAGKVFRAQADDAGRPSEYQQAGYEIFERENPAAADAEVFALFGDVLSPLGLRAMTGDLGILMAAVQGLRTSGQRKAALMRHIWRPRRFRALLDRYSGCKPLPASRQRILKALKAQTPESMTANAAPVPGLRSMSEIADRLAVLQDDAAEAPIGRDEADLLDEIVNLRGAAPNALEHLRDIAVDAPSIRPAVDSMARRLDEMTSRKIDTSGLEFEGSHGRTTLEYYDGFVFSFSASARPDLPPVATGGRYDALTRVLGGGRSIPAVGGVIRPGLVAMLKGGARWS